MKNNQPRSKCNQNVVHSNVIDEALSLFRQLDVIQQEEFLDALRSRVNKQVPAPVPQESA